MNKKRIYFLLPILIVLISAGVSGRTLAQNDHTIFLPSVVKSEPTSVGGNQILAAGEFDLLPEFEPTQVGEEEELPVEEIDDPDGPLRSISCTTKNMTASDVRELVDRLPFKTDIGVIYPGALIQGNSYLNGTYTPITIPRSGGTITMEGVTLKPGSSYSQEISVIGPDTVQNGRQRILENYIEGGTAADYGDDFQRTYSYQHMLFTLGIDARYGVGSMEADLSVDTTSKTNYVFYKFHQKFYDVVYTAPESSVSVFRDGGNYVEPDAGIFQIAPKNPPLYVHKVSYGRIVYFVAESQYSSQDIEATLEAAVDAKAYSAELRTGLTYEQVMKSTRITTFVLGGNAGDAVQNVKAGTAKDRFEAITSFVGDYGNANFSAQNPGKPIGYELRYLKNRQTAKMSYTTDYSEKNCVTTIELPEPPPPPAQMWVRFGEVHNRAKLYHNGEKILDSKDDGATQFAIHEYLTGKGLNLNLNHEFTMTLDPDSHPFDDDGKVRLEYFVGSKNNHAGTKSWDCQKNFCSSGLSWTYRVNVKNGTWQNK